MREQKKEIQGQIACKRKNQEDKKYVVKNLYGRQRE